MTDGEKLAMCVETIEAATQALCADVVLMSDGEHVPSDEYAFGLLNATLTVLEEDDPE